jgi:hypothetical protein
MRQTIAFQATGFEASPVQVEIEGNAEVPDEGAIPAALLAFESGGSLVVTLPVGSTDAENMMNAINQAEPMRQSVPDAQSWQPQSAGFPPGMIWALTPTVIGVSVTPPQMTPEGPVPHWTLAFDDEDGSQVQVAISDAMCVQLVRALAQVARGEFTGE